MATKVIYFIVEGKPEQAEFRSDDTQEEVREVFRAAAEASPNDILKLYNIKGNLVNISAKLSENTPDSRYQLDVIAAHLNGSRSGTQPEFDLASLQQRLEHLEKKVLVEGGTIPDVVFEIKQKVDDFRERLQHVNHLSWLGLYKDMSSGTSLQQIWANPQGSSGKKSPQHCQLVFDQFLQISKVAITEEVREYLKKPAFDNWQWDDPEMLVLLRQMFIDLELHSKFNIDMNTLNLWLFEIYKNYNQVPFHNFKHCFMVAQMMYGLTWLIDLPKLVEDLDVFTLLVSAICHDLDHPGYNNAYQVNAKTELALRYNDISPLENHHCSVAFEIMGIDRCNIFKNLTKEQFKRVREGMIKCILATDMAKHSEILNNFKSISTEFDFNNKDHKVMLMCVLIKVSDVSNEARPTDVSEAWLDCLLTEFFRQLYMIMIKVADVSNECRPVPVSELWLECLLEEYFAQSDVEKLEGLPVAPFMDRDKVTKSTCQTGFIKFVLLPLFEALAKLFPIIIEDIVMPVRQALDYYQTMQNAMEEKPAQKTTQKDTDTPTVSSQNKTKTATATNDT